MALAMRERPEGKPAAMAPSNNGHAKQYKGQAVSRGVAVCGFGGPCVEWRAFHLDMGNYQITNAYEENTTKTKRTWAVHRISYAYLSCIKCVQNSRPRYACFV